VDDRLAAVRPGVEVDVTREPIGGTKGSSFGARERGHYAAEFYTAVKTAYALPQ
jgi:acyl-CoA reductase-like NAD-dependent aldehyde dehydrogenase